MKLGKLKPEFNNNDLLFSSLMKAVPIPTVYDWDVLHPNLPTPMFANDSLGDCVMAGRAHQTLRFEFIEQKQVINISDAEVTKEYFNETGGGDDGLVVSRSLREWKRTGWAVGGKTYKIKAYSRLNRFNRTQVKTAIYSDLGVGIGFEVPQSAMEQFDKAEPWHVVADDGGILGGHYVFCYAYDTHSIKCVTWGQRQLMTWEFWDKYCDEVWAIFDAANSTQKQRATLDLAAIDDWTKTV